MTFTNFQSVDASELLTGCLCHGYLDVYASLWTTWKLVCGESSSNLPMDGRRLKVKNEATFIFKGNISRFYRLKLYLICLQ